jgi:hypothetical protein
VGEDTSDIGIQWVFDALLLRLEIDEIHRQSFPIVNIGERKR